MVGREAIDPSSHADRTIFVIHGFCCDDPDEIDATIEGQLEQYERDIEEEQQYEEYIKEKEERGE